MKNNIDSKICKWRVKKAIIEHEYDKLLLFKSDNTPRLAKNMIDCFSDVISDLKKLNEAIGSEDDKCDHNFVDARNQVIECGEHCTKCGLIR